MKEQHPVTSALVGAGYWGNKLLPKLLKSGAIVRGSFYIGEQRPATSPAYGQILFTFEEFAREWKGNKEPLRIVIKEKNLTRLSSNVGSAPRGLTNFKDYALVTNR